MDFGTTINIVAIVLSMIAIVVSSAIAIRQSRIMHNANLVPVITEVLTEFNSPDFKSELRYVLQDLRRECPTTTRFDDLPANYRTNAELAAEFNRAPSTIYNIKVKHRSRIDDLRRKMSVQFQDLFMTRKQARLHDIQHLRDLAWDQLRALLASNCVIDGRTGEVRAGPVDERKFKVFVELILKANRNFAEECGQLPQRVEGLDQRFTLPVLGLSSGGGIDYAASAQRRRDREATVPDREAAEQERREAARERTDAMMRQLMAAISPPSPDPEVGEDEDTEDAFEHDDESDFSCLLGW